MSDFRFPWLAPLALRIVDQQGVFQVQIEGARVQVVAGQQGIALVDPDTLEVEGVITVFPQMHIEAVLGDCLLMLVGKASQADLIEIGQGGDHLERLIRIDEEVVGGLVANDDIDLHAALERPIDLAGDGDRQVEVWRADGQLDLARRDQVTNGAVETVARSDAQQRNDAHFAVFLFARRGVVGGAFQVAAKRADLAAQTA